MAARLGRYEVLKHLASGGMADVLLGRTEGIEGFERHVVLKRIKPVYAQDLRFIRMFLDEARVAATLHHQHIVQVHDVGESAGEYFIAMEYLHGEDVRTILRSASRSHQHVPLSYAMAIVSAAAAGLHYAHERRGPDKQPLGIVHRDISPSNILVGYDGSIKVVDFGLAKASARQESRTGSLKGKISYMSPEQCKSAEIDRRSDVYSLGVVLYELATTSRLFKGTNDYLVMDQIVNGRVPLPPARRPDLPAELSAIILRAIAPDPEGRFSTADELRRAIDHVADKLGLIASSSAITAYMRQQFGEKPEPWLDLGGQVIASLDGVGSAGSRPGSGWTELWRSDSLSRGSGPPLGSGPSLASGPSLGTGPMPRASEPRGTGVGDSTPRAEEGPGVRRRVGLRPSTASTDAKMGWESQRPARVVISTGATMLTAAMAAPLIASIGIGIWWFAQGDALPTPRVEGKPVTAIPPIEEVTALASPAPAPKPDEVVPVPALAAQAAQVRSAEISTGGLSKRSSRRASTAKGIEPAAPAAGPGQELPSSGFSPVPPEVAASPALAAVAPATPADVSITPGPSAARDRAAVVDPPVLLSHVLVERVASGHARELSRCDGSEELRGEITVRFSVDPAGRVSKAQVTTIVPKPDVAACIVRLVQTWKFPPQGEAGAQGTYTQSFQ